jgi:hypothetical protein
MASGERFHLQIAVLSDAPAEAALFEGQEQPPQGWVSPRFGERVPAPVLSSRCRGPLPLAWVTVLMPHPSPLTTAGGHIDTRGAVVTLEHSGGRGIYAHSFTDTAGTPSAHLAAGEEPSGPSSSPSSLPPWLELGGGRFRGKALHLQIDESGQPVAWCMVGGFALEWDGRLIWQAENGPEDCTEAMMATHRIGC